MKVFIKCKSPLLEKTLKSFLKDIETNSIKEADICLSDAKLKYHNTIIIGKDIKHPFTKDMLLFEISNYLQSSQNKLLEAQLNKAVQEIKNLQDKKINKIVKNIR